MMEIAAVLIIGSWIFIAGVTVGLLLSGKLHVVWKPGPGWGPRHDKDGDIYCWMK